MRSSITIMFMLLSLLAHAEADKAYGGLALHWGEYKEDALDDVRPMGLQLKLGNYLHERLAIEGHYTRGISEGSVTEFGVNIDLEVDHILSVFLKADLPLNERARMYGLVGMSTGKLKARASIASFSFGVSESDSGLSYGLGIESRNTTGNIGFRAEYVVYLSEDDYDYNGLNIGLVRYF